MFSSSAAIFCVLPSLFVYFFKFDATNFSSLFLTIVSFFFDFRYSLLSFIISFFFFNFFFQGRFYRCWWIFFFFFYSRCYFNLCASSTVISAGLWNGLVFIHPLVTFFSFFFLVNLFCLLYFKFVLLKDFFFYKYLCLTFFFYCSLVSILLGSWWAQQELNWGGWWSWDPIELGSFYLFVCSIFLLHFQFSDKNFPLFFYFFIFFFISVRLGLFNSIHSFVSESLRFNCVFLIFIIFFILFTFNFFKAFNRKSFLFFSLLFMFSMRSTNLNLGFFSIFFSSIIFYFGFAQRSNLLLLPVPLIFFPFFLLKKKKFAHYIYLYTVLYLFFFKSTFFFFKNITLQIDSFFLLDDVYIFIFSMPMYGFFFFNSFSTVVAPLLIIWQIPSSNFFVSLAGISLELIQQSLYFYNWFFLSQVFNFCFLSFLLSFSFVFFFFKKKNSFF